MQCYAVVPEATRASGAQVSWNSNIVPQLRQLTTMAYVNQDDACLEIWSIAKSSLLACTRRILSAGAVTEVVLHVHQQLSRGNTCTAPVTFQTGKARVF